MTALGKGVARVAPLVGLASAQAKDIGETGVGSREVRRLILGVNVEVGVEARSIGVALVEDGDGDRDLLAWIGVGWVNGDALDGQVHAGPQGDDVYLLPFFDHRVEGGAGVAPVAGADGDGLPHRDAQRIGAEVHAVVGKTAGWAIARRGVEQAVVAADGDVGPVHGEAVVVHIAVGTASWGGSAHRGDPTAVVGQGIGCDAALSLAGLKSQAAEDHQSPHHQKNQ